MSPDAPREGPVVTLDGPAGSGKSTTAREVASRLGFRHLDSGALYRALTWALLETGMPEQEWADLEPADFSDLPLEIRPGEDDVGIYWEGRRLDAELRLPVVTERVSELASLPAVRSWLLEAQRRAGVRGRLVADGRDMGTVVFPDADLKVFLTADLGERARRRLAQEGGGEPGRAGADEHPGSDTEELRAEAERLARRDRRDREREHSPLQRPDDAWVLDTTELDFEEQVARIVAAVRALTVP